MNRWILLRYRIGKLYYILSQTLSNVFHHLYILKSKNDGDLEMCNFRSTLITTSTYIKYVYICIFQFILFYCFYLFYNDIYKPFKFH